MDHNIWAYVKTVFFVSYANRNNSNAKLDVDH